MASHTCDFAERRCPLKRRQASSHSQTAENLMRLSIACPAYNEAAGIREVVEHWMEFLPTIPDLADFEVVVCNDGSRDDTGAILDALALRYPSLKPVHH